MIVQILFCIYISSVVFALKLIGLTPHEIFRLGTHHARNPLFKSFHPRSAFTLHKLLTSNEYSYLKRDHYSMVLYNEWDDEFKECMLKLYLDYPNTSPLHQTVLEFKPLLKYPLILDKYLDMMNGDGTKAVQCHNGKIISDIAFYHVLSLNHLQKIFEWSSNCRNGVFDFVIIDPNLLLNVKYTHSKIEIQRFVQAGLPFIIGKSLFALTPYIEFYLLRLIHEDPLRFRISVTRMFLSCLTDLLENEASMAEIDTIFSSQLKEIMMEIKLDILFQALSVLSTETKKLSESQFNVIWIESEQQYKSAVQSSNHWNITQSFVNMCIFLRLSLGYEFDFGKISFKLEKLDLLTKFVNKDPSLIPVFKHHLYLEYYFTKSLFQNGQYQDEIEEYCTIFSINTNQFGEIIPFFCMDYNQQLSYFRNWLSKEIYSGSLPISNTNHFGNYISYHQIWQSFHAALLEISTDKASIFISQSHISEFMVEGHEGSFTYLHELINVAIVGTFNPTMFSLLKETLEGQFCWNWDEYASLKIIVSNFYYFISHRISLPTYFVSLIIPRNLTEFTWKGMMEQIESTMCHTDKSVSIEWEEPANFEDYSDFWRSNRGKEYSNSILYDLLTQPQIK